MPLLLGCLALFAPRVVIVLVVLFSDYLGTAYETLLWPLLGFVFLPLTTLAYAFAWHSGTPGTVSGFGVLITAGAVLLDLGLLGGGGRLSRRRRSRMD